MCAIAGSASSLDVQRMLEKMVHRAPDGTRVIMYDDFSIGMGRLAIIDLNLGDKFPYEFDDATIAFNGELFNYVEIREELKELGYTFETNSDTEVFLKGYLEWGVACFDKYNGMFAAAIYEGDTVLIVRDRAGEKPLYFSEMPFAFASEAKALNFNCDELRPGHYIIYDLAEGEGVLTRWWKPQHITFGSYDEARDILEETLVDSVKLRTRSDVPYGLYFSGGIDSSLIASCGNFEHRFTYSDGDYKKEFMSLFPKIMWHLDYPIQSFSAFALYKLAQRAQKHGVKVILSGEGADELFDGYVRHVPHWINYQMKKKFPSYQSLFPFDGDPGLKEFHGNMQELLRMEDRMTGAFGVENRSPFLDPRIIDIAFSIPMEWKFDGYDGKRMLRDIVKKRVPGYQFREKHGLYCSIPQWLGSTDKLDKSKYVEYQKAIWEEMTGRPLYSPIGR